MTDKASPLLVFGGTFDPPHLAHVELPRRAAELISAKRIIYVPAAQSPHKTTAPTPAEHRVAMLRIALRHISNAEISMIELDRAGPSYMVETLHALRGQVHSDTPMRLLIGADQAVAFHRWHRWQEIISLAEPLIMLRPPWDRERLQDELARHHGPDSANAWMSWVIDLPLVDVAATTLREHFLRSKDAEPVDIDPEVARYIRQHRLYDSAGELD